MTRLLVEGGGELHAAFIGEHLADRFLLYVAPRLIGGKGARALVGGEGAAMMNDVNELKYHCSYRVGKEIVIQAELR